MAITAPAAVWRAIEVVIGPSAEAKSILGKVNTVPLGRVLEDDAGYAFQIVRAAVL